MNAVINHLTDTNQVKKIGYVDVEGIDQKMPRLSKKKVIFAFVIVIIWVSGIIEFSAKSSSNLNHQYDYNTQFLDSNNSLEKNAQQVVIPENQKRSSSIVSTTDNLRKQTVIKYPGLKQKPNIKFLNSQDIEPFTGDILILVTSSIAHKDRRDAIRTTWGNSSRFIEYRKNFTNNNLSYKVYFNTGFLESSIGNAKIESATFKDLLITNRTENYWDLSRRVMLAFSWALEHCAFDYLLKADDDVFIK